MQVVRGYFDAVIAGGSAKPLEPNLKAGKDIKTRFRA
jgi:hypothetical protein